MRYYLDTEFCETGYARIDLISIALVREDGLGFYAVASDGWDEDAVRTMPNGWLAANVLPHLGPKEGRITRAEIRDGIREFIGIDRPQVWGYYADYDWVLFCQLFGRMVDLPKGFPMFCRDLKQLMGDRDKSGLPLQTGVGHNALADAQWIRQAHRWLLTEEARKIAGGP